MSCILFCRPCALAVEVDGEAVVACKSLDGDLGTVGCDFGIAAFAVAGVAYIVAQVVGVANIASAVVDKTCCRLSRCGCDMFCGSNRFYTFSIDAILLEGRLIQSKNYIESTFS